MEEYNKIYPEVPKEVPKEAPKEAQIKFIPKPRKTAKPSAYNNLAGFLRTLKRRQSITEVSGKSTKDVSTSCQESAHQQELFRFVSVVLESEQLFLGLACLSPHHLEALVLFVELRVLSPAKPGKRFLGK